jgi:hypothetical protein
MPARAGTFAEDVNEDQAQQRTYTTLRSHIIKKGIRTLRNMRTECQSEQEPLLKKLMRMAFDLGSFLG